MRKHAYKNEATNIDYKNAPAFLRVQVHFRGFSWDVFHHVFDCLCCQRRLLHPWLTSFVYALDKTTFPLLS